MACHANSRLSRVLTFMRAVWRLKIAQRTCQRLALLSPSRLYESQEGAAMSSRSEEFREFVRDRASPLHQSAYLLCGDWHTAHDLVQETLIKAYRHWSR